VEASTLQAPAGLAPHRIAIGIPLLRLRSDEQLVALFRAGHDEAFRVIHDRYEKRLLAYTRQMLPRGHDAEGVLQDVFVRAYSGLRSSQRELALRAWLFRVAHNRCIDELRRPAPPAPEVLQLVSRTVHDPVADADRRESLRRLIVDVRRLPDQQRSALLMREMGGTSYAELAAALGTSVPAVKSLLVRARIALVQAATARDTACSEIREELVGAYDRGVRPNGNAKRHIRDCAGCRSFKRELRTVNRRVAALAPLGPLALLAKTLGLSGGAGAGSGATASGAGAGGATAGGATAGGATALGGAAGGGGAIAGGALVVGTGHVATLLAAAVATAGGAVAISAPPAHPHVRPPANVQSAASPLTDGGSGGQAAATQDAAATAVGVSLLDQSEAGVAAQATRAGIKHKPTRTAPASSASTIPATTALTTTSSTDGTSTGPNAGTSLGTTLNGGTVPNATGTSTGAGSPTASSGTATPSSTDTSSTSGSQPSGSSPPSATTNGGSGTPTNTTNSGASGGSRNGPETSPDTYSSAKTGSSGATSSSSK
jgi:RNA polymerase sigma factor (sigma-70 family)